GPASRRSRLRSRRERAWRRCAPLAGETPAPRRMVCSNCDNPAAERALRRRAGEEAAAHGWAEVALSTCPDATWGRADGATRRYWRQAAARVLAAVRVR